MFREGAIDYPDPSIAWKIVEKYGVSKMFTAPTALRMFMRYGEKIPQQHDLTSLRVIACAGEPLNPEAWRWAQTYLAGDGKWGYVVDNWWQTELGGPALGTPATLPMRPGKAGLPLPGCDADVVDIDGKPVAPGVSGRLILKRPFPMMMRTIWGNAARAERDWQDIPERLRDGRSRGEGRRRIHRGHRPRRRRAQRCRSSHWHGGNRERAGIASGDCRSGGHRCSGRVEGRSHRRLRAVARRTCRVRRLAGRTDRACTPRDGSHRNAVGDQVRKRTAQDALRQDHAPPA